MYKVTSEVIKFMENTLENWRVELTEEGKRLIEEKITRRVFQGDALSLLLFVIIMVPLRKCTGGYKLHKLQEKD